MAVQILHRAKAPHSDVHHMRIGLQYVSWTLVHVLVLAVQQVNEIEQEIIFPQVRRLHVCLHTDTSYGANSSANRF